MEEHCDMIKLYHGSDIKVTQIDLSKGHINKDFGRGFYLTSLPDQAMEMAIRKARQSLDAQPVVSSFMFDDGSLTSGELNVRIFPEVSTEWAEFILANRHATRNGFHHDYDIVIGPVANDGVVRQLDLYEMGLITIEQLVEALRYRKLNNQYFFGTQRSLNYLTAL